MKIYSKTLLVAFSLLSVASAVPPRAPSGFSWSPVPELTDEFEGASIDTSKWDDYHPHWSGRAPSQFKQGNAYVSGGNLNLKSTMQRDPSTVSDPFSDIWVDAAACVSKGWSAKPGYYYEARVKASNLSMTSSFWFRVGQYSEIDVIEHIGNPSNNSRDADLPYQYHANTHYYGQYAGTSPLADEWVMPTRGRDEYHVYGFWWKDPNTLWFYHNNVKVMEIIPRHPLAEDLKMIFDTEVFPWATAGVANIGLPLPENLNDDTKNTMKVAWVRTYKLEGSPVAPAFVAKVEAEEFDVAGYYDTTIMNQGGEYRLDESVDLQTTLDAGGGYNVGWTVNGEWLEYTMGAYSTGIDTLSFRVASIYSGKSLRIDLDGQSLGSISVPNTGNWQVYETITMSNLNLSAGVDHTVRITFEGGGVNLNYFEVYGINTFSGWSRNFTQDIGGMTDDFDGDERNNLYEYALNGNPVDPAESGTDPILAKLNENTMQFIHVQRRDDTNLVYSIDTRTNLSAGDWNPAGYTGVGAGDIGNGFDRTTNSIPITEPHAFYRLRVSAGSQ